MVYLSRPYPFRFFIGCLPQILLGPLLNTLFQLIQFLINIPIEFMHVLKRKKGPKSLVSEENTL